ncbi:MAG: hypothetical protein AAGD11_18690 [Planctomycetota bacterium]
MVTTRGATATAAQLHKPLGLAESRAGAMVGTDKFKSELEEGRLYYNESVAWIPISFVGRALDGSLVAAEQRSQI